MQTDEQIIEQGSDDKCVYLLQEGSVGVYDPTSESPNVLLNKIIAGHYFGERSVLFDGPRLLQVRALETVRCWVIDGERMLQLLKQSRPFAQSLGTILRARQGIFDAFDRFKVELMRSINEGYINIAHLLSLYRTLQPILHRHVNDREHIDFAALSYAVRRLPENISSTFVFLLVDELPLVYTDLKSIFRSIQSPARRREIWELMPGKNLVLLRNGLSDLTDLVTCICLYAVEARKIRERLAWLFDNEAAYAATPNRTRRCWQHCPLVPRSAPDLTGVWPHDTIGAPARHSLSPRDVRRVGSSPAHQL